ncbi:MAG: protease modulator HflC [Gammaproteobacteria bacterium]
MSNRNLTIIIILAAVLGLLYKSAYTVNATQYAILMALGKIEKSNVKPGLHWMIPFYNVVYKFDKRLQSYDAPKQRYLTQDRQPLDVDYYVQWRISNVETFYKKMQGSIHNAQRTFDSIINKSLLDAFGQRTMWELISNERADVMSEITKEADKKISSYGIKIVDVRVMRIELPDKIRHQVFQQMIAERNKEAAKYRAQGVGKATQIKAEADKSSQILLAQAYEDAQKIRGQGDAQAARIYAKAYGKNPEFFAFYRSLQAYRDALGNNNGQIMVLQPDSDFFKYFNAIKPGK